MSPLTSLNEIDCHTIESHWIHELHCPAPLGLNNSKVCAAFTAPVITSTATCKRLFSCVVCHSPGIMCAVEWCDMMFFTAGMAFRGCVWHSKTIGMPSHTFMVGYLLEFPFCTNLANVLLAPPSNPQSVLPSTITRISFPHLATLTIQ